MRLVCLILAGFVVGCGTRADADKDGQQVRQKEQPAPVEQKPLPKEQPKEEKKTEQPKEKVYSARDIYLMASKETAWFKEHFRGKIITIEGKTDEASVAPDEQLVAVYLCHSDNDRFRQDRVNIGFKRQASGSDFKGFDLKREFVGNVVVHTFPWSKGETIRVRGKVGYLEPDGVVVMPDAELLP